MSNFIVNPAIDQIDKIISSINALPEQVNKASVFALNRTAEWLKGSVSKSLSREKRIKLKIIRDAIKIMRADNKNLRSLLNCDFRGVPARDLGSMRQTPVGATAGGHLFRHAFIATMKKGGNPGIYRRKGKERFPVRSVRLPIFNDAMKIINELIGEEASAVFAKRFLHEISRLTGALI